MKKKVPMCVMAWIRVKCCVFMCISGQQRPSSLSAAGGSAGLVEAHSFAQPAGKVHFLHFWSLDECVILKKKTKKYKEANVSM